MSEINLTVPVEGFLEDLSRLVGKETSELQTELIESVEGGEFKLKEGVNIFDLLKSSRSELVERYKRERKDQYNRGLKEGASKIESAIRGLGEFDPELKGDELISAFVEAQKSALGAELNEEFLSKNPVANQWLNNKLRKQLEASEALKAEYDQKLSAIERERKAEKVDSFVFDWLQQNKWNAGDGDLVGSRKNAIRAVLNYDKISIDDNGDFVIVDENGVPARDSYEHPIKFTDQLRQIGEAIGGFNKVNPNPDPPSPNPGGGLIVKTDEQLKSQIEKANELRAKGDVRGALKLHNEAIKSYVENQKG